MARRKVMIRTKPLLRIRAHRNMSQNGLARVARLTSGHVSQLIARKRNVSPAIRARIQAALPDVLFDEIFTTRISDKR